MNTFIKNVVFLTCLVSAVIANNLVITNVQRSIPGSNVSFNISWQNSWYVTGTPSNHDAAWVFIKFRPCGATGAWGHALLSTNMSEHSLSSGLAFAEPILTTDRMGGGTNNNTGAMIRRATVGTGHIVNQNVTLRIVGANGPYTWDPNTQYDIRVFGIEMVQIPQGTNIVGDATSTSTLQTAPGNNTPFPISSEFPAGGVTLYDNYVFLNVTVPQNFPKGYNQFYCMKYEISMGQYAEFLNTVSPQVFNARQNLANNGNFRFNMYISGGRVRTDKEDRACNYLSGEDVFTYLDWAALRPMTELEFEKVCKGTGVFPPGGYAWGSTSFVRVDSIQLTTENGTEIVLDLNANCHADYNATWFCNCIRGGDAGNYTTNMQGPIGCGILARDNTLTRETTGGTFYGVMEMSGNVQEWIIPITNTTSRNYTGLWGDGMPSDATGRYDTGSWPAPGNTGGYNHFGTKGGSWALPASNARVSDRAYVSNFSGRNSDLGGRGVR